MKRFLCKSDFSIVGKTLSKSGDIILEDQNLTSEDGSMNIKMDLLTINNSSCFQEIIDNLDIKIKEVNQEEEIIEKDWIIQIKVTATRKKLRDIEDFLRNNLAEIL